MTTKKLFNDPIYGLIDFPHFIYYEVIDHPSFQRLRRIGQMGFTSLVYPGATNTRFHHAMGALHLTTKAIQVLRSKGVEISEAEEKATGLAILLHDIGHGPFSHALEGIILKKHHEELSLSIMSALNEEWKGELDLCLEIFENRYAKKFLYQLVSSQLDMDRMDYLIRDTYYTGVAEGTIGYDRLIKMLNVSDNQLVVEEKGIYSVEKFLVARKLMYWQVYLHKTALAAESMLKKCVERAKVLLLQGKKVHVSRALSDLILETYDGGDYLSAFLKLDDSDIYMMIKENSDNEDFLLQYWCKCLLERRLYKVYFSNEPFEKKLTIDQTKQLQKHFSIEEDVAKHMIVKGVIDNNMYNFNEEEIKIRRKDASVYPYSTISRSIYTNNEDRRYYICIPRI